MTTHVKRDTGLGNHTAPALSTSNARAAAQPAGNPVLCVDLDGTLIKSDLLWECILVLLKTKPYWLFLLPYWLLTGRANLKRQLAVHAELNPGSLPYRPEVLDLLRREHSAGRQLVLATASDVRLARSVADQLGLFVAVFGSDGKTNLKGVVKARHLHEQFCAEGFEYLGDSQDDLPVWQASKGAYVVGEQDLLNRAAKIVPVRASFAPERGSLMTWIHALRGHHWFKNALLFLPLALAHKSNPLGWLETAAGFVLFGFCASGLYVLNDLLDLHSDRGHPWKQKRPFAAGSISIPEGLAISLVFLAASLTAAFLLSQKFGITLCGYAVLTIWYSVSIKKIVLLDVFILSSFYSIRLLAGGLITATPLSQWFLVFSLFFFLSLAMAKRYSELLHAGELVKSGMSGRGYVAGDRELLLVLGAASSFASVVILSLYVHSQEVGALYKKPGPLLLVCPIILYWLSRIWLKAHRGDLYEDPVTFAIRDPVSYAAGAAAVLVVFAAMLGIAF